MRRRSTTWLSGLALALALLAAAPAQARTVRVFAMGPKLDVAGWMQSGADYRAKMFALADKRMRGPGTPLVQDGADDFASHLRADGRNLVVWPEDIGLFAALTGERAAPARASGSLEGAIVTLIGLYGPQNAYYGERFPDLPGRVPQTRLLTVSLTDTFGRWVIETFSQMADRYDVWLHAGVNMAQEWHVVCNSRASMPALPGGVTCDEENPDKVSRLRDPFEPERTYAYEATSGRPSNMALLFGPDGRLVSKQVKTYLTPIELPGQLDLVPGTIDGGLSAVRTPVGTLGFVTSKDAWMPDVLQRLDQAGVDVLVQPEFFVNDIVCETDCGPMWAPDTLRASGYNDVLRHPSIEALVLPELAGNVFNFSADAQQHIALKPRRSGGGAHLIGQPPAPGLRNVMPWVVPDPQSGDFAARREALRRAGEALKPGSGVPCADPARPGPCENGHVEGVLWRDIEVARRPAYRRHRARRARTRFSRSRPVAPSRYRQRNATVALRGRRGVVAWEERGAVRIAFSRDGGRRWTRARRLAAGAWPSVALGAGGRVTLAWQSGDQIRVGRVRFGGRHGAGTVLGSGWKPSLAQGRGDVVHATWIDRSERSSEDELPQAHVRYARIEGGRTGASRRLDGGEPKPLAAKLDNSWAPSVAARGERVLVTWIDFLNYDWDVFSRASGDGGRSFGEQVAVNDTPEDDEALNDTPRAALGGSRALVAWTDWRKRDSQRAPHQAYDIYVASPGSANRQVDPYGTRQASTFSPAICADGRNDALIAFQDASRGQNDIRLVRVRGGDRAGRAHRVDDGGRTAGNAWRPQLACWNRRVLAAWEDERDGPPQIYAATASASRLP